MSNNEIVRIKKAYAKREKSGKTKLYSLLNKSALYLYHQREKAILETLASQGIENLSDKKILDVGCGVGGVLRDFVKYGTDPSNCFGIDLLPDRIEKAKKLSPNMHFICGNAEKLPYGDKEFDLILTFTVFSSILDNTMKQNIAKEMLRVLKPEGIILWYDYFRDNPKNPDVRGVKKKEIYELFPNCSIYLKRVTLAPPIARLIAPRSFLLCYLLEKIPLLRTHYLGVIRKKND